MNNFKPVDNRRVGITYIHNGQLKPLYRVRFEAKKGETYNREDIREYAQDKSNKIAQMYPNEAMAVILEHEYFMNSGGFTDVGDQIQLYDDTYDEIDRRDISGFQILFTFSIPDNF